MHVCITGKFGSIGIPLRCSSGEGWRATTQRGLTTKDQVWLFFNVRISVVSFKIFLVSPGPDGGLADWLAGCSRSDVKRQPFVLA